MRTAALLTLVAVLTSCAGSPVSTVPHSDWPDHLQSMTQLQSWSASGKAALRRDGAVESASLVWRQRAAQTQLRLTGPLGAGATTLRTEGTLLAIDGNGQRRVIDLALHPEQLAEETGWDIPITALPYWLRGIPAPEPRPELVNTDPERGYALRIVQSLWTIDYASYGGFDGYQFPTRITLAKGDQRLTVLLRNWQVDDLQ